jgi:hypothetical protein
MLRPFGRLAENGERSKLMSAIDLARAYISRVNGREGRAAAALFSEDGVIVAPNGHQYRGRDATAAFVEAAPPRTISSLDGHEV